MLSSWYGEDYNVVEAAVQDTFLPIFWAQEFSEASAQQVAAFRPMPEIMEAGGRPDTRQPAAPPTKRGGMKLPYF